MKKLGILSDRIIPAVGGVMLCTVGEFMGRSLTGVLHRPIKFLCLSVVAELSTVEFIMCKLPIGFLIYAKSYGIALRNKVVLNTLGSCP